MILRVGWLALYIYLLIMGVCALLACLLLGSLLCTRHTYNRTIATTEKRERDKKQPPHTERRTKAVQISNNVAYPTDLMTLNPM